MRPRRGERRSAWRERREIPREDGRRAGKRRARRLRIAGGDGGIRTLDRALQPYNGLANRRLQPLGHISAARDVCTLAVICPTARVIARPAAPAQSRTAHAGDLATGLVERDALLPWREQKSRGIAVR